MIDKTLSSGAVIGKIYRDLNLQDPNWEEDAIEWIGEALAHIGVGPQLERKSKLLAIENHRVKLPIDHFRLLEILFYEGAPDFTVDGGTGVITFPSLDNITPRPLPHSTTHRSPALTEGSDYQGPESYFVTDGVVMTTFERGILSAIYLGMLVDDNGYPMVPDDPSFMDAFLWYIIKQMMIGGWRHPSPEFNFEMAEFRWLKYCSQARSKAKMPNMPQYDEIVRNWTRMVETRDRRAEFFDSDNEPTRRIYGNEPFEFNPFP